MKENSIEECIKRLEKSTEDMWFDLIYSQKDKDKDIQILLSDYKRVLKENEEKTTILLAGAEKVKQLEKENKKLKEDRNNNNEMIALARNEVLNYMTGYEDGKKHKMTATAQVVENQQYYIIQKQMEKYEEHIKRLQKENEELLELKVSASAHNRILELEKENKELKDFKKQVTDIESTNFIKYKNYISIQKIKDKIEEEKLPLTIVGGRKNKKTLEYGIKLGRRQALQELIEEREKKKW